MSGAARGVQTASALPAEHRSAAAARNSTENAMPTRCAVASLSTLVDATAESLPFNEGLIQVAEPGVGEDD
jgi:hypothetical protein